MRELIFAASDEALAEVMRLLDEELDAAGCPDRTRMQLQIAVEEIFVNIVRYAYPDGTGEATLQVWREDDPRRIVVRFADGGPRYNPLEAAAPDTTLPAEERAIGGLGIFLARKSVDAMEYEYTGGRNVTTMTKLL